MKSLATCLLATLALAPATPRPERDEPDKPATPTWVKQRTGRDKPDILHDATQNVRGDSGRWNDDDRLQHAPPMARKPPKVSLDDWADRLLKQKFQVGSDQDNWLILRTRQLDDNDRIWVERIERRGNQFTVVTHLAVWQGRYFKNFTYYGVLGVNLGKLDPGTYEARWIVKPLAFRKFQPPGRPRDNWPGDARAAGEAASELGVRFTVSPP